MTNEKQDSPNFDALVKAGRGADSSAKFDEGLGDLGGSLVARRPLHADHDKPVDISDLYGERGGPAEAQSPAKFKGGAK